MNIRSTSWLALAMLQIGMAGNALAATVYTDRSLFEAALMSSTVEDFESYTSGDFTGSDVLFAGLMMTDSGPKVLEFNARFGDPETQAIMARMRSDIVPLLQQGAAGQLGDTKVQWAKEPAVCVVLASRGYPETPETGHVVQGLESLKDWSDVVVYHAATRREGDEIKTVGGRVLGVTALGANLETAIKRAYEAVDHISFEGMHYRRDIGFKALMRSDERKGAPQRG